MPEPKKSTTVQKPKRRRSTASLVASPAVRRAEQEQSTDSAAAKRVLAALLATLSPSARASAERLITDPELRAAVNAYRTPSKLDRARVDFDAAILGAVTACLSLADEYSTKVFTARAVIAADAGHELQLAGAALKRAQNEHAPIPVRLTPKAEVAVLKRREANERIRKAGGGIAPFAKRMVRQ